MRKQKTLKLNPDITVTVFELRPRDIKQAVSLLRDGGDFDFQKLLTEDWDDALAKLAGVIRADRGDIEEVSFSEIEQIQSAFVEVNAAFFGLLAKLGLNIGTVGASLNNSSIEPAADSSNEDTRIAGTMAGAST